MGRVSEDWRVGNKRPDELAFKARVLQTNGSWGDCDRYTAIYAVRQRSYATLTKQIMTRNARVYMKFQEMLAEKEKQKPYTETALQERVPRYLEFAEPTDGRARLFYFQVCGILNAHIKDSLPTERFNVRAFLCGIRIVPTCSIGNGISWLDLYALFLVQTGQT